MFRAFKIKFFIYKYLLWQSLKSTISLCILKDKSKKIYPRPVFNEMEKRVHIPIAGKTEEYSI